MCIFCEKWKNVDPDDYLLGDVEKCEKLKRKRCTIITGFLGAGKTTFLNYVLGANHGRKIGVLINEFGEVTIDDKLLKNKAKSMATENMQVMSMQNGCVCCTVRGDLVDALAQFGKDDNNESAKTDLDMDYLILECSGMSEVIPVAQTFYEPDVQKNFVLDGVVCVIDALNYFRDIVHPSVNLCETIEEIDADTTAATINTNGNNAPEHLFDSNAGTTLLEQPGNNDRVQLDDTRANRAKLVLEQLALADVVLLNKIDLVSKNQRDSVLKDVREKNGSIEVVPCRRGKVSLDQVLGIKRFSLDDKQARTDFLGGGSSGSNAKPTPKNHIMKAGGVMSVSVTESREPLDLVRFRSWFSDLFMRYSSQKILRCKGILDVQDGPFMQYKLQIQGVAEHVEWDMIQTRQVGQERLGQVQQNTNYSDEETQGSKLVIIFQNPRGLNSEEMRLGFEKCRYSVAKAARDGMTPAEKAIGSAFL